VHYPCSIAPKSKLGERADSTLRMHLVGVRDFYMSHFFDVAQRVAAVTRLDAGEDLLIYVERAWVDYWTGLASIKR
jgi:hypothetical protein